MNLFVYGTLLVPRIWEAVTLCPDLRSSDATLSGYRIARVKNGDFPAIAESPEGTGQVPGRLFHDVPAAAVTRLDQYEDRFYERVEVSVDVGEGSHLANAYRVPLARADEILSNSSWTLEWFEENALESYWNRLFC